MFSTFFFSSWCLLCVGGKHSPVSWNDPDINHETIFSCNLLQPVLIRTMLISWQGLMICICFFHSLQIATLWDSHFRNCVSSVPGEFLPCWELTHWKVSPDRSLGRCSPRLYLQEWLLGQVFAHRPCYIKEKVRKAAIVSLNCEKGCQWYLLISPGIALEDAVLMGSAGVCWKRSSACFLDCHLNSVLRNIINKHSLFPFCATGFLDSWCSCPQSCLFQAGESTSI